tara:strand:+ start:308 stop:1309 length:1002 start_codon:yes stop_codon:yes gene_type:complete
MQTALCLTNLGRLVGLCLLTTGCGLDSHPKTALETWDFEEVQAEAMRLGEKYGPEKVLLVFDIDNTLLAMRRGLGSDQWFGWQYGLEEGDPYRLGDLGALVDIQGLLYAASSMRPTFEEQPDRVRELQAKGFPALMLTSRDHIFRDSTRRELANNGYDFNESAPKPHPEKAIGFIGPFLPFGETPDEQAGLSADEVDHWLKNEDGSPRSPRLASYSEGVFMTAGQDKGLMLRLLLERLGRTGEYEAIVFVDDHKRHSVRMQRAYRDDESIELTTFLYSVEDGAVAAFYGNEEGALDTATEDWRRLWDLINEVVDPAFELPDYEPAQDSGSTVR